MQLCTYKTVSTEQTDSNVGLISILHLVYVKKKLTGILRYILPDMMTYAVYRVEACREANVKILTYVCFCVTVFFEAI